MELLEHRDLGMICKGCHKRIKWKDYYCIYEMQNGDIFRTWFCDWCGAAVREDNITELWLHYQLKQEEPTKGGENMKVSELRDALAEFDPDAEIKIRVSIIVPDDVEVTSDEDEIVDDGELLEITDHRAILLYRQGEVHIIADKVFE